MANTCKLLVCAATRFELAAYWNPDEASRYADFEREAEHAGFAFAVTGVGIPETLLRLLPLAQRLRPARILNIGIAGAYPQTGVTVGDIVVADTEVYGDIGFELPEKPGFQPVSTVPFGAFYAPALMLSVDPEFTREQPGMRLHIARGCTVNTCTGTARLGRLRHALHLASFETMEGAAVAQVGLQEGIPVTEVRAISNIAARRDMKPENIKLALENLHIYLQACRASATERTP